jgi:hypothetical protein
VLYMSWVLAMCTTTTEIPFIPNLYHLAAELSILKMRSGSVVLLIDF